MAAAAIASLAGCSEQHGDVAPTIGAVLDTNRLQLLDLDGKSIDLRTASAGLIRVAVFTRSDCPVSNQAAPEIRSLYNDFHPQGVDFYLVYVDPNQRPDEIREHLRQYEYPCDAVRDPAHSLVAQTGATVTPEAVIFDKDWRIAYRGRINDKYEEVGKPRSSTNRHDLRDAIESTLAGKPVAEPIVTAVGCYIRDLK
jgi:AhpC/TSA family